MVYKNPTIHNDVISEYSSDEILSPPCNGILIVSGIYGKRYYKIDEVYKKCDLLRRVLFFLNESVHNDNLVDTIDQIISIEHVYDSIYEIIYT